MTAELAQAYPSRIAAIKALVARCELADGDRLRTCAAQLGVAATLFGKAEVAADWKAFAAALDIIAFLADWRDAVQQAEQDADRFLRAARAHLRKLGPEGGNRTFAVALVERLATIEGAFEPEDVRALRAALAGIAMPVGLFRIEEHRHPRLSENVPSNPEDIAVAFLEFAIDGQAAETLHRLTAGQIHDLDLTIRVSRWPASAERLIIAPLSIEPSSTWDFPKFEFDKPAGEPPYVFRRQGRMALHTSQSFNARPLEFRYAVEFQPSAQRGTDRVVLAGQRTLRLDGTDTSLNPITGYADIDKKVADVRDALRRDSAIPERTIRDLLTLLAPIGNLMGQAVQDKRFPNAIDEAAFQRDIQSFLRANPRIGVELEVQSQIAGGRVDLAFRGVRVELKSERTKRLLPEDCRQYAEQAASYAVGAGGRVALLCVLDCSPKSQPPFPIADGLTIIEVKTGASPVYVVSCLIQGGLARPSDLSR